MEPIRRRSRCGSIASTGAPSISTRPALGSTSRLTVLSKVDLPDPDAPTNATKLPAVMSTDTPSTATVPPGSRLPTASNATEGTRAGAGEGVPRGCGEDDAPGQPPRQ